MKTIAIKLSLALVMLLAGTGLTEQQSGTDSHAAGIPISTEQIKLGEKYNSLKGDILTKAREEGISKEQLQAIVDSPETVTGVSSDKAFELRKLVSDFREVHDELHTETADTSTLIGKVFSGGESSGSEQSRRESGSAAGDQKEREVEEEAKKRAAKKAAEGRDQIRALEQAQNQNQLAQQLAAAQQGGQGGKGKNSGGESDSGSSQGPAGFPQQNNSDDNSQNQFSNGFDRLANRLGNIGNHGFGNFSSSQNSSKKDDDKKPSFSLPPSKNSAGDDFKLDTKPKTSLNLPQIQTGNQSMDLGKSTGFGMQGTPVPAGSYSNNSSNFGMNSGNSGSGMSGGTGAGMGGMLGAQPGSNQASLGSLGGDFPFNITGETFDEEAEYDGSPRYRVYDVSMTGSSTGGGDGASAGEAATSNEFSSQSFKKNGIPQFLYFITPEEQSLKGVPGIFRSLSAGYQKTRVQMLCHLKDRKKIGLCEKVRKDLDI